MRPIKIKLSYTELLHLAVYIEAAARKAYHAQASEELIVLAEHEVVIQKRLVSASYRDQRKAYPYSMPLSVARILHKRWQNEPIAQGLIMVLWAIDYELMQRRMKPEAGKMMYD